VNYAVVNFCENLLFYNNEIPNNAITLNDDIDEFPTCLCDLSQLKSLTINSSEITLLPECIRQLNNLEELTINNSKIALLPDWIGQLNNLEELNIGNSKISKIPKTISKLKSLRVLSCLDNEIKTIPKELFLLDSLELFYWDSALLNFINNKISEEQHNWVVDRIPPAPELDGTFGLLEEAKSKKTNPDFFDISEDLFRLYKSDNSKWFVSNKRKSKLYLIPYTDYAITTAILTNKEIVDSDIARMLKSEGINYDDDNSSLVMTSIESIKGIRLDLSFQDVLEILGVPDAQTQSKNRISASWNFIMSEDDNVIGNVGLRPYVLDGLGFDAKLEFNEGRLEQVVYRYEVP